MAAELSVVVPSVNGWDDLAGCLAALDTQRSEVALEVLVADRCGEPLRHRVAERFPWVRVLAAAPGSTIPQLRAQAFEAATADAVAVIEDHVLVPSGWARALLAARTPEAGAVAGAVANAATGRLVDWAAFLCEYSHLLPPLPAGAVAGVTGNNTLYPRALLTRYREVIARGGWENELHEAMRRDGLALICRPEIVVGHKMHYTVGLYLSQRYLYSRSYAGARVAAAPLGRRLVYGLAAFALPPLVFWRVVSTVWRKGGHRGELLRSLPLLALFATAWGLGEIVGYWAGAGDALRRVR